MTLKPLGDRYLVRPLGPKPMTDSGLHLVEHKKPEQLGVVVSSGVAAHPRKAEADQLAEALDDGVPVEGEDRPFTHRVASMLRTLTAREPVAQPGDLVVFSWLAGQELLLHDTEDRLLIIPEADLLAVIEP